MNAQIASASSFTSRRHRMARWMGKAGPIYVAVVIVVVEIPCALHHFTQPRPIAVFAVSPLPAAALVLALAGVLVIVVVAVAPISLVARLL